MSTILSVSGRRQLLLQFACRTTALLLLVGFGLLCWKGLADLAGRGPVHGDRAWAVRSGGASTELDRGKGWLLVAQPRDPAHLYESGYDDGRGSGSNARCRPAPRGRKR